ncbi:MAG: hydroxyethylthiazole kinase [bacterium]|jgi:hydroxyethylthiazole kinase|nr:hydroxyethylthiazole kinase [Bacillota bacterium]
MNWIESICNLNEKVRQDHPLIHHITNLVVTNVTANVTLAVGAAPVMLGAVEDAAAMTQHAQALVLNCGTLSPDSVEAMLAAGQAANENNIPVVLDPVAVGTTPFRTEMILKILQQVKCTVIRGNSSEMGFLAGKGVRPRGVDARPDDHLDSTALDKDRSELAAKLAGKYSATAAVTGRYDYVSDGNRLVRIDNGHPLLTVVTGTGCMATSVIAAWTAVAQDPFLAAAGALAAYGVAAEIAAEKADGPGTFQANLFDAVYNLNAEHLRDRLKISVNMEV